MMLEIARLGCNAIPALAFSTRTSRRRLWHRSEEMPSSHHQISHQTEGASFVGELVSHNLSDSHVGSSPSNLYDDARDYHTLQFVMFKFGHQKLVVCPHGAALLPHNGF
jgi:hypothetical protein